MLEKGLEGRSLDDVLLWLDAVYKHVGPATLEGATLSAKPRICSYTRLVSVVSQCVVGIRVQPMRLTTSECAG